MTQSGFHLRPYHDGDFDAAMEVWLKARQNAYPEFDFQKRLEGWKQRWLNELLPTGEAIVATDDAQNLIGFIMLTPANGYLEQIAVLPDWHGKGVAKALLDYAKGRNGGAITLHVSRDNARAVRFYQREGFIISGETTDIHLGVPVYEMAWHRD